MLAIVAKPLRRVELLYFDGCPHWRIAASRLDEVCAARGLSVTRVEVTTAEQAEALGFRGSPSILVDGHDPFARSEDPIGLTCRLYRTPDGPAGAPTISQLEAIFGG
ncbi:MAG: thioredoxin family protein [Actinobacteria bacterium]|nr:thioredoxin family protein [Actinomycetota bacterium]